MASDPAVPVSNEHRAGDLIAGRYELKKQLGEGGMGVVWLAHSAALDVDVALKVLRRELAGTQAVERMAREARTAAQLGHPAMVRVLDFGTSEQGEPFLAMELLEGEELRERLHREQRLPAATAAALMLPVIDGLGTAHEKGIVHRDIKPENIFIATDSQRRVQPKLLDFGIAKLSDDRAPSRLTQVGAVVGSPYYLSPEQAEGLDDLDFRCDIWAVGVVLYELVTGAPPFAAGNYNAQLRSILNDKPKPITEHGVGDAQLWLIIERCLQKDRDERWTTIWELGEALALWLFERGVRVDISSRSLRHGWLDGTITGVKLLVASQAPEAEPLPVRLVESEPPASDGAVELERTHLRRRRRGLRPGPLLFAAGALAVLTCALWLRFHPSNPARVAKPEEAPLATVSAQVVPPLVQPHPAPEPVAAPAMSQVPPAELAPRTKKAQPAPRHARSGPPAQAAGERVRHKTEFGF